MKKPEAITYLTTNCKCWKGEEKTLETFTENKLVELVEADKVNQENALTVNALKEVIEEDGDELPTVNDMPAFLKKKADSAKPAPGKSAPVEDEEEEEEEPVKNVLTTEEWLATAPAEVQSVVRNSMNRDARYKQVVINKLIEGVDPAKAKILVANFKNKSIDDLETLLILKTPVTNEETPPVLDPRDTFFLPTPNPNPIVNGKPKNWDAADVLPLPTVNFKKVKQKD